MKKQETRLETLRRYLSVLEEIDNDPNAQYIIPDPDDFDYMEERVKRLIKEKKWE